MMASAFIAVASVFQTLEHYLSVVKNGIQNLWRQHADLEEKIDRKLINEEDAREEVGSLQEQVAALDLHGKKTLQQGRERAKEVFGLLMRAGFRREKDEHSKFQPCKDDLDFLKGMDPALCRRLRTGSLKTFCRILYPIDSVLQRKQETLTDEIINESLQRRDSIFHLHGNSVELDVKEFVDLKKRADVLAERISRIRTRNERQALLQPADPVRVRLLDGHGRMLVSLIKAVMDLGLDPDKVLNVTVFEIDEEVHEYHRYVFPRCVEKRNETVIDIRNVKEEDRNSVVYLNFCSITSGSDAKAWCSHFRNQTIHDWVPHCCKENVLKFIWKVTHPPHCCTVMVSLVIMDRTNRKKHSCLKKTVGDFITGLGFITLLRKENLFNADIVSLRPTTGIKWKNGGKRNPEKLNVRCPFVTLLIGPNNDGRQIETEKLQKAFKDWNIADLREDTLQNRASVSIVGGKHKGKNTVINDRTVAEVKTEYGDINIHLCQP